MFSTQNRGQVGIGTLIVFIAMVLVAAIAAGVLINTAGLLQSQASQTGEEATAEVSDTLQLSTVTGTVSSSSIETVNIKTRLGAGSGPIDLSETVFIIESEGTAATTTVSSSEISVEQGSLTDSTVLTDQGDVASVQIDLTSVDGEDLSLGKKDEIRIVAQAPSGSSSEINGKAPRDLQTSHIL